MTFRAAERAFGLYGVEFTPEKYCALGITQQNNKIYTNLALLFSDQCTHTIKVAVFSDDACTIFRDSKEFGGSIFKQFEDTINYLALCNKTVSTINGIMRTDKPDYPEEVIGEHLGVKKTHIFNITKQMRELGLIQIVGRGKDKKISSLNHNINGII